MLKVGIIGCGMITKHRHAPEYAARRDVQLCAWYDAAPGRAEEMAAQYGGRVYSDWKQLIEQGELDAVSVCSPNATHAEISVFALERGLHVLCEKPMATSLPDCERMVSAGQKAGRLLFIGQNQRFSKTHIKARAIIESGQIGRVLRFQSSFGHEGPEIWTKNSNTWFYDKNQAAFGAVFDLGIHKVDLLHYLLGERFVEVCAMLGTLDKKHSDGTLISVDDNAAMILRTAEGAIGTVSASWTNYGQEENATRIYGAEGVLHIFEDPKKPLYIQKGKRRRIVRDIEAMQTNENQFDTGIISAFVEAIQGGREASAAGESVCHAMRTVFGAVQSAQTGRRVRI